MTNPPPPPHGESPLGEPQPVYLVRNPASPLPRMKPKWPKRLLLGSVGFLLAASLVVALAGGSKEFKAPPDSPAFAMINVDAREHETVVTYTVSSVNSVEPLWRAIVDANDGGVEALQVTMTCDATGKPIAYGRLSNDSNSPTMNLDAGEDNLVLEGDAACP